MQNIGRASILFLALSSPAAAIADVYQIRAIGASTASGGGAVATSDWTLVFNDLSGDRLLQVDEIVSFSGATVTASATYQYDRIAGTPAIEGISTGSGGLDVCCWWFQGPVMAEPLQDGWFPRRWLVYAIGPVTAGELLSDLISTVVEINLSPGRGHALDAKLEQALDALDRAKSGDAPAAIGVMYAFMQSVAAQRGTSLTEDQANALLLAANAVVAALESEPS